MKEILLCQFWQNCFRQHKSFFAEGRLKETASRMCAFSLVEMLMALLVASLLLAALAPVMTKRMDEAKINVSGVGAAQYDKDAIIQIYTGAADEDKVFNVPSDVNMIKATLIGGGGAGGNSFYGKQEVTTSRSWTVPAGVTKLRVFMLGGGGGGASGGLGTGTATIPAGGDGNTYKDFLTAGEHTFTIPSSATSVPELNEACKASGKTAWTGVSDGQSYTPGKVAVSVTACGGGGGGGGAAYSSSIVGGGGGSGGYKTNIQLSGTLSSINIIVGGGGGGGSVHLKASGPAPGWSGGGGGASGNYAPGTATGYGGNGGESSMRASGGHQKPAWSGVGGKPNGLPTLSVKAQKEGGAGASGAGTGGTGAQRCDMSNEGRIAGGGGGGGVWGGGGGGGGSCSNSGSGGGGGGAATGITDNNGNILFQVSGGGGGGAPSPNCCGHYAGGGGGGGGGEGGGNGGHGCPTAGDNYSHGYAGTGGKNGNASTAGVITNIFGNNHCNGGNGGTNNSVGAAGKPGALRLYYTYPALKCDYSLPANGSGGGGAGQIVVGEIDVTPGETLYFEIGNGGSTQAAAGKNGNAGYATNIRRGSASGTIIAQALGGFGGQYSSAETTPSYGGNSRPTVAIGSGNTISDNWTGTSFAANSNRGENGNLATAILNKGFGGAGGNSVNIKGEVLQGGAGGNSVKNGASPDIKAYGAGGGGGAGSPVIGDTTFGIGASGAAGYIYFEYGGSNGGGGTSGEMITKLITNIKGGTEIKINVGDGGDNSTGDGNGKSSSIEYSTSSTKTLTARGGLRGNDGLIKNVHGEEKLLPDTYANKNDVTTKGSAGEALHGGIGGYIEKLYENPDGTYASYIKAKDGTIGGPVLGGCGGNLTALMGSITCNGTTSTPNGKNGTFGGGGGGGAVINETGGLGGKGGRGMIILEYKSTAI